MDPSEVTETVRRLLDRDDASTTEPTSNEVAEAFRRLLDQDGVSATEPTSAVVEEVSDLVARYEEVRPEVDRLRAELSDDADASGRTELSLLDVFEGDGRIEEWRTNHPDTVDELESIQEAFVWDILGKSIDIDDERFDEDEAPDVIETFLDQVESDVQLVTDNES